MSIEELKRLAEAASDVNWMHLCRENPVVFSGKYAAFIAAANPAAMLELIRQRDELLAALKVFADKYNSAPDGDLGIGLVNGDFFRAIDAIARAEAT